MTDTEWLAGLKVGDEVAVPSHHPGGRATVAKVQRETDASLWVCGRRFRRSDGYSVGDQTPIYQVRLRPVTEEDRQAVKRDALINALCGVAIPFRLESVPTSRIEQALAILKGETES